MTYNSLIGEIKKLPPHRRLKIIEDIYNTLDEEPIVLTRAEKAELLRRVKEHEQNPGTAIPLDVVLAEMSRKTK